MVFMGCIPVEMKSWCQRSSDVFTAEFMAEELSTCTASSQRLQAELFCVN